MNKARPLFAIALIFGCDDREFVAGPPNDAEIEEDERLTIPAIRVKEESLRQDGALDTIIIIDTVSYPDAQARDVEDEMIWFNAFMQAYFDIPVNYMYEPIFAARNQGENDQVFAQRVIWEDELEYPEYVALFSYGVNNTARIYGGYCCGMLYPEDYCNEFRVEGLSLVIVGVVDLTHLFGRCGYDGKTGEQVSSTSFGGECRGIDGVPCVSNGSYYVCEDILNHPWAEDLNLFHAFVMAHEFMHAWGPYHVCGYTEPDGYVELDSCEYDDEILQIENALNICGCNIVRFLDSHELCYKRP